MPRVTPQQVKDLFVKYGYILPQNFKYKNGDQKFKVFDEQNDQYVKLSYNQLKYNIEKAPTKRQPYFDKDLMALPLNNGPAPRDSFERFCEHQRPEFQNLDNHSKHIAFDFYKQCVPVIARHERTTIGFKKDADDKARLYGLVQALQTVDYSQYDVRLTLHANGTITFCHANQNTINYLYESFFDYEDVGDSSQAILNSVLNIDKIDLEFIPVNRDGHRRAPGFFPWTHKVDGLNLTKYGIYRKEEDIVNESCLITAFRMSGILSDDELKLLESMVKTRHVLKSELRKIAETFHITINVQIVTNYENGKTSHDDYSYGDRKIKLIIMFDHYMLNETTKTPFCKIKLGPFKIVQNLMKNDLLVPLSERTKKKLICNFKQMSEENIDCPLCVRPLIVKEIKTPIFKRSAKQSKRFFGYEPLDKEIDQRLAELQSAIDTLPLRRKIDVQAYYRFSDLAQRILFETGCFDGVYELTGKKAADIRKTLVFPSTKISDGSKHLYLSGKYYYLDINAAYMNFVKEIPSGIDDGFVNTKIGSIIARLYDLRLNAKQNGNTKLATTLKFIMNSTWGYSISRPKVIKHKFAQDVNKYKEQFGKFILKQNGNFIDSVNCFATHYTYPQFAKSVLDHYNQFFDQIKKSIKVYYENVDAILTDEEGYHVLLDQNMISDTIMGKFKIDKIFTEFAAISSKRYVATTIEGDQIFHCIKNMDYDEVISLAQI